MRSTSGEFWCIDLKADVRSYKALAQLWNECINLVSYDGKAQILATYSIFHLSGERDKKTRWPVPKMYDKQLKGNVEREEHQHGAGWHMHNLLWVEDAERGKKLADSIVETWQGVCKKHKKEWKKGETKARRCNDLGKVAYVLLQEICMTTKSWGFRGRQDRQDFFRRARALLRIEDNNRSSFILWQDNLNRAWYDVSGGDVLYKLYIIEHDNTSEHERKQQLRRIKEICSKRRYFPDMLKPKMLYQLAVEVHTRLKRRGLDDFLDYAMGTQNKQQEEAVYCRDIEQQTYIDSDDIKVFGNME